MNWENLGLANEKALIIYDTVISIIEACVQARFNIYFNYRNNFASKHLLLIFF